MTPSRPTLRRSFLRSSLALVAAPALWLMNRLAQRAETLPETSQAAVAVPLDPRNGIRFFDRFIAVTAPEGVSVFSSVCPHLGCRINQAEEGELVCPCHGSRFNSRGAVLRGPAARNLQPLAFALDRDRGMLRVFLKK